MCEALTIHLVGMGQNLPMYFRELEKTNQLEFVLKKLLCVRWRMIILTVGIDIALSLNTSRNGQTNLNI